MAPVDGRVVRASGVGAGGGHCSREQAPGAAMWCCARDATERSSSLSSAAAWTNGTLGPRRPSTASIPTPAPCDTLASVRSPVENRARSVGEVPPPAAGSTSQQLKVAQAGVPTAAQCTSVTPLAPPAAPAPALPPRLLPLMKGLRVCGLWAQSDSDAAPPGPARFLASVLCRNARHARLEGVGSAVLTYGKGGKGKGEGEEESTECASPLPARPFNTAN